MARTYTASILTAILLLFSVSGQAQSVSPFMGLSNVQFFDNSGVPLTNGVLYSYQAGTSTQQATFTSSTGLIQNVNPITFTTGARATIWLTSTAFYKFVLCVQNDGPTCASQDILFSVDNVPGGSSSSGGGSPFTGIFISSSLNPSTTGILRLASSDTICWRNAAGNANLCISKDAQDYLVWAGGTFKLPEVSCGAGVANFDTLCADGSHRWKFSNNGAALDVLVGANTTDTLTNKTLTSPVINTPTVTGGTFATPTITTPVINGASTGTGVQGTDSKLQSAGTISGTGAIFCTDANGGTTTVGCGDNRYFSVTGCAPAASTDSSCTGNITIAAGGYADSSYIPQLTINSINGAFLAVSVSGSLTSTQIPYTITCTFNCASISTPTIYVFTHHN